MEREEIGTGKDSHVILVLLSMYNKNHVNPRSRVRPVIVFFLVPHDLIFLPCLRKVRAKVYSHFLSFRDI